MRSTSDRRAVLMTADMEAAFFTVFFGVLLRYRLNFESTWGTLRAPTSPPASAAYGKVAGVGCLVSRALGTILFAYANRGVLMSRPIELREISNEEGSRLLQIVRRGGGGNVVMWRRAQIVLWAAQGYPVQRTAEIGFTSEDRVGEVIHGFNQDRFESLSPNYGGGRPAKFDDDTRAEIVR